jgi:hypothetical protein
LAKQEMALSVYPAVIFFLAAIIAAAGFVMLYLWWREDKRPEEIVTATSEWQPTGKIDFHAQLPQADKLPAVFVLRVEDYRSVESISGAERVEIRWRNATLTEAKALVAHQNAADPGAKLYEFPRQVRPLIDQADKKSPGLAGHP